MQTDHRVLKDTILTVNVVEPELVQAIHMLAEHLGQDLQGLVLVHKDYAQQSGRPRDDSGLFTEIICDFNNPDELQHALKPYIDRILAATCRYEEAMQPFSKVIPFLPYVHTPSEAAMFWSTEKPLMRDRLRNYDKALVPKYVHIKQADLTALDKNVQGFSYPLIIKPAGLSKALLVARCNNFQELSDNLKHAFGIINEIYEREQYPGQPGILIEEMMQGDMYSVDAYVSHRGKISCLPAVKVTTAHEAGLPGFYGYEQITPAGLTEEEEAGAFAASTAAIKALNLSATTAHVELFHTKDGWKIIEIAARIGGFRNTLYREAFGIEHFYNDLLVRMGEDPIMPGKALRVAGAMKVYAETEGRIESITGVEEARALPSIVSLKIVVPEGDLSIFANEGGDPIIEAVLSNKDPETLQKDMQCVRQLIKIQVRPSKQLAIRRARLDDPNSPRTSYNRASSENSGQN